MYQHQLVLSVEVEDVVALLADVQLVLVAAHVARLVALVGGGDVDGVGGGHVGVQALFFAVVAVEGICVG